MQNRQIRVREMLLCFLVMMLAVILILPTQAVCRTDENGNVYFVEENREAEEWSASDFAVLQSGEEIVQGGIRYLPDGDSVKVIGYDADSIPVNLDIPNSVSYEGETYTVKTITTGAFLNCQALRSVTLPDSVTRLEKSAFENCNNLQSVTVSGAVKSVDQQAFYGCLALESFTVEGDGDCWTDGVSLCVGDTLVQYPLGKKLEEYKVPDNVKTIGAYAFAYPSSNHNSTYPHHIDLNAVEEIFYVAFEYSTDLQYVDFGNSLQYIHYGAFENGGLIEAHFPATLTEVDDCVFRDCDSLRAITVAQGCQNYFSQDDVLFGYQDGKMAVKVYPPAKNSTVYEIPAQIAGEAVTVIAHSAFDSAKFLEEVTIPDSVIEIESDAFSVTRNLKHVEIPGSVERIGSHAFQGCQFKTLKLSEGLKTLGDKAFRGSSLVSIELPASLETIGNNPFESCEKLKEISVKNGSEYFSSVDGVLFDKEKTKLITYPLASENTVFTIPKEVTVIEESAFSRAENLQALRVESGNSCFSADTDGVLYEGSALHTYPYKKTDVSYIVRNGTKEIGAYAFYYNFFISSVNLGEGLEVIREDAFAGCSSLQQINLPQSLTKLERSAFFGTGLKSVIIPENVQYMEHQVADYCHNLEYAEFLPHADALTCYSLDWDSSENLKYVYVPEGEHSAYLKKFAGGNLPLYTMVVEGRKGSTDDTEKTLEEVLANPNPAKEEIIAAANQVQRLTNAESLQISNEQIAALDQLVNKHFPELSVQLDTPKTLDIQVDGLALASGYTEDNQRNAVALSVENVTGGSGAKLGDALLELSCDFRVNQAQVAPRSPLLFSVPYTEEMRKLGENLKVLHVNGSQNQNVDYQRDNDKITFRAYSFSNYAIVDGRNYPAGNINRKNLAFRDAETLLLPLNIRSDAQILLAAYQKNGKMLTCQIVNEPLRPGAEISIDWKSEDFAVCRAFMLDGNGCPITGKVEFMP